jgi:hypothetical protein
MNDQRPTRDSMFIEEATVSNMWEIAAIVEGLERESGVFTMDQSTAQEARQEARCQRKPLHNKEKTHG